MKLTIPGAVRRIATAFPIAACLAALEIVVALALAYFGFHRLWQLSVLLPAFAFLDLAVAWLIHLRKDGFGSSKTRHEKDEKGRHDGHGPRGAPWGLRLALAAILLLVLSTLLYAAFGVGASYFSSSLK